MFITNGKDKRGKCSSPRIVLDFDPDSWTVTVPTSSGRAMKAAAEDIRLAVNEESFTSLVCEGKDRLDSSIEELFDAFQVDDTKNMSDINQDSIFNKDDKREASSNFAENDNTVLLPVGDSIEVLCPIDNQYYNGTVAEISEKMFIRFIMMTASWKTFLHIERKLDIFDLSYAPGIVCSNFSSKK